jgi:type II secretory pathway pseudopilin PulG
MTGVAIGVAVALVVLLLMAAVISYRKHSATARRRSAAALATLLADAELIAASGRRASDDSPSTRAADPSAVAPIPAAADPLREAYERGYRQGFGDGRAAAAGTDTGEG